MPCEHLLPIMAFTERAGIKKISQGLTWSKMAGEWAYYDCHFAFRMAQRLFSLPDFVIWHELLGTHEGSEAGFVCEKCQTGVMGRHSSIGQDLPYIP
ncbi:hypothetical protein [Kiloniella laminariae]|uniref:hypothetical protein n=1 Tax=Kiloniella laminariae TaxID=454162 RepID=UPI000382601A|nr:hypothetical protein [Kiloniella laminariae]